MVFIELLVSGSFSGIVPPHAASHKTAGTDVILVDELGSPTDNTNNDFNTSHHGFAPKGSGVAGEFLAADGTWKTPAGTGTGEVNTASNAGLTGVGVVLVKSGTDLPFKSIAANSNKIAVSNDATNRAVNIDVTEANLTLSNIGGAISTFQAATGTVFVTSTQSIANKTIPTDTNFIKHSTTNNAGDILVNTGTVFDRFPLGAANQLLAVNTAGNNIAFKNPTFASSTLSIQNPAGTFAYILVGSAIAANRNVTLPLLAGNDTFAFIGFNNAWSVVQNFPNLSTVGTNLVLSSTGLSAARTITFPDSTTTVVGTSDSRLSDARTPTAHKTTHQTGGSDSIPLDTLAATTDVTTLNSTTSAHGLLKKLSGNATDYQDGTGNWSVPVGTVTTANFSYTYFVYKSGSTYFAQTGSGPTAALTSNASFATLLNGIISAISPAGTATYIRIAAGDYDLAAQVTIPTTAIGNIVIEGAGIGLTNINITSAWNGIALGTQAIKIGAFPTIAAGITGTLTANCAIRTNTCTVSTADAAKFAVGDYILLTSTLAWSTAPSAGSPQTEMKKITAINTGTGVITFDVPTFDTYNTANTAVIYRLSNMLTNIRLSGLTVRKGSGLTTDTGNTTGVEYLTAVCVDNFQVDNCQFIDPVTNFDACLNLKTCVNSEVSNSSFIMTPANTYNLQYGVAIGSCCQNVQVTNCRAFGRFRHSFEGANDSASTARQGIARNITFASCVAEGSEVGAFDTHVGGEFISFVNCKVMGTTTSTGNVGFEIRTRKTQLIGCSVEGASTYGFQFSGDAHECIVSGCEARACLTEGIRLINDQAGIKRTIITGCTFVDNGNNGIRLDSGCDYTTITNNVVYNNQNNGMYLAGSDFLLINSNTVINSANSGIWVDPLALTLSNIQVTNNTTLNNGSLQVKTSTSTSGGTVSATSVNNVINWNTGFTTNIQQYNQIINATNNTITDTSTAAGDLLRSNATKFSRMARGTNNQVLASTTTDIAWTSLNSENTGTATATANGSTTTFTIAHGLGSTPYMALVVCSSHTNTFTYTYDSTNITVVFTPTAPSATPTATITFQFRVVA